MFTDGLARSPDNYFVRLRAGYFAHCPPRLPLAGDVLTLTPHNQDVFREVPGAVILRYNSAVPFLSYCPIVFHGMKCYYRITNHVDQAFDLFGVMCNAEYMVGDLKFG